MLEKILIVDDEEEIVDPIGVYLRDESVNVYKFYSGEEALVCIGSTDFDLAILDIMLPDISGLPICQSIRSKEYTHPVIMFTAKDEETNKITGFTLGVNDYITKLFLPLELVTRVKAQLRHYKKYNVGSTVPAVDEIFECAGLTMNIKTYGCRPNGETLSLTLTEFSILGILLGRKCSVVSAEELFHEVWQKEYYTKSSNTATVHIRHLCEETKDIGENPRYIKTVWGVEYRIGEI